MNIPMPQTIMDYLIEQGFTKFVYFDKSGMFLISNENRILPFHIDAMWTLYFYMRKLSDKSGTLQDDTPPNKSW
jgi:hypothetical protein